MATSKIEWTDKTWNPFTGCSPISEGCANCYAAQFAKRLEANPITAEKYKNGFTPTFHPELLDEPGKWIKPQRIFVVSMGDLFHKDNSFMDIQAVFETMIKYPQHTYFVLTKRPELMLRFVKSSLLMNQIGKCNIYLGVSAENQKQADSRIPVLLEAIDHLKFCNNPLTFNIKSFVSIEPMIGPVNLFNYLPAIIGHNKFCHNNGDLDWVVCGGESGANARPYHPNWIYSLRNQCEYSQVPFFFKSFGSWFTSWQNINKKEFFWKFYTSYQQFCNKLWVNKGDVCIDFKGQVLKNGGDFKTATYPVVILSKVSKLLSNSILHKKRIQPPSHLKTSHLPQQKHDHFNQNNSIVIASVAKQPVN